MIVYLIGPSGSGKTDLRKQLPLQTFGLDQVMNDMHRNIAGGPSNSNSAQMYFDTAKHFLKSKESETNQEEMFIADVGPGFLEVDKYLPFAPSKAFFEKRRNRLIYLYVEANIGYQRDCGRGGYWSNRSLDEYKQVEYAQWREAIYNLGIRCDASGDPKATLSNFADILERLNKNLL